MKKILVVAAASLVASSALAQGLLNWNTAGSTGSTIRYGSNAAFGAAANTVYDGSFAGSSPLNSGIWSGPAGTPESGLTFQPNSLKVVGIAGPGKGNIQGMGSYSFAAYAPGTTISLQIRAWSGSSFGQTIGSVSAKSGVTQIALGGGLVPTPIAWSTAGVASAPLYDSLAPTGTGPLQGFTLSIVVPEPASASLLGLGLASLLIFRRRK